MSGRNKEVEQFEDLLTELKLSVNGSSIYPEVSKKIILQEVTEQYDIPNKGIQTIKRLVSNVVYSALSSDESRYVIYQEAFRQNLMNNNGQIVAEPIDDFTKRVDNVMSAKQYGYDDRIKDETHIQITRGFTSRSK